MASPKVSVIVPVFNVKTYLRECLDSILNQTLSEIEILCGDGGSTDGSLEILQEYAQKDPRVRYMTEKGSGYGQSVNDCMDMAQGEYIGIVESDDAIKPNTYEVLYGLAKKNDLDWIRGDIYYYYSGLPKEEQLVRESIIYGGDFYNVVLNPQTDYRPYKSGLRTWSGIYKKEFLNKNGIRHNETPGGSYQDVGFYLKTLYYAQRVYFVDQAFYMWRQDNPGSSVHYNSSKLVEKSLKEWQLNREYLDEHPNIGKRAVASYNYRKFFSYLWTIDMAEGEDKTHVRKIAAEEFTEALDKGEIDKNLFEEWEWSRFIETLQDWKSEKQDAQAKEPPVNEESSDTLKSAFSCKRALKKVLRPAANFMRKIVYKLMRNMILDIHYDVDMLRIRINETAGDTQWQVRESAAQLENSVRAIIGIAENLEETISQSKEIFEQIDARLGAMEAKVQMLELTSGVAEIVSSTQQEVQNQRAVLKDIKTCEETIYGKVAEIEQKVLDQGDVLWSVKCRNEDIHNKAAEGLKKTLDQGEIIWSVKTRTEDIHEKVAEILTKVLDQGDIIWAIRDKTKDIELFNKKNAEAQAWNMLCELNPNRVAESISASPLYDSAFYLNNRYGSVLSAQHILSVIFRDYPHRSVVDFGCGTGTWLWVAKALGTEIVYGIDGDYVPKSLLMIDENEFHPADLQKPIHLARSFDLAISVEVAEHLCEESADDFVDSICKSADVVLFSAAHPGQGGDGHINEQPLDYWKDKFETHKFKMKEIKQLFKDDDRIEWWYRENIALFYRDQ